VVTTLFKGKGNGFLFVPSLSTDVEMPSYPGQWPYRARVAAVQLEAERVQVILRLLTETFGEVRLRHPQLQPFELLVGTILSQHTNDRNSDRAFDRLSQTYAIIPQALAIADESKVRDAIQVAGLQRHKARTIIAVAKAVLEQFSGDLGRALALGPDLAREALMGLPGVGPKTADVVLLFSRTAYTFPIDTHIARVSKRLGFVPKKSGYEQMRERLQGLFRPEAYLQAHLLLIQLGRSYCTALRPRHDECPVRDYCPKLMDCP